MWTLDQPQQAGLEIYDSSEKAHSLNLKKRQEVSINLFKRYQLVSELKFNKLKEAFLFELINLSDTFSRVFNNEPSRGG
jgi:hypothetical protein